MTLRQHELAAIAQLVMVARALADQVWIGDASYARQLRAWAKIVEDAIERMERADDARPDGVPANGDERHP